MNATAKDIDANIKKYIRFGTEIKAYLLDWEKMDGFPKMELYVPADHDEFVQLAFDKKFITEQQILEVDCNIIEGCKLRIACNDWTSRRGMVVEIEYAQRKHIPIYYMASESSHGISSLNCAIKILLLKKL